MSQVSKKLLENGKHQGKIFPNEKQTFDRPQTPERTSKRQKNNTEAKRDTHHVPVSRWQKFFGFNLKKKEPIRIFGEKIGKFLLVEKNRVITLMCFHWTAR